MSIDINLAVQRTNLDGEYFCFRHAVIRVCSGETITEEVVQVDPEYGIEQCKDCYPIQEMFSVDLDNVATGVTPAPTPAIEAAKAELAKRNQDLEEAEAEQPFDSEHVCDDSCRHLPPSHRYKNPCGREAWEADKQAGRLDD